jgi:polyisoprenoid-binding protein YceI
MTSTINETTVPAGTWNADRVHSSLTFEVPYAVNTFSGEVRDFDVTLEDGKLAGAGKIATLSVKDENLEAHLQSPEFFDAEKHPELRFESTAFRRDGDEVVVDGQITIKGETRPIEARGTTVGPLEDPMGNTKLGLALMTVVNRTDFGLNWQAPMPKGGVALGEDVTLNVDLEFFKA